MLKSFLNYLFIAGVISLFFFSCVKKKSYPTIPEIEYKDFYIFEGDSAAIEIKFKDGDGDIGVEAEDSTRSLYYTYYYFDTITQKYSGFYSNDLNDTVRIGYVLKSPTDAYKGKPISGEINVRMQQYRHSKKIKKLKYTVFLIDKAGNKSNVVTSPEIIAP